MNTTQVHPRLLKLTVPHWRALCHELDLSVSGRKDEVIVRVLAFLRSEEGRKRVHSSDSSTLLRHVGEVLNLPRPQGDKTPLQQNGREIRCTCGGAVRQGFTVLCTRCGLYQHRICIGAAASMSEYECLACQLSQLEPLQPVIDTIFEPSAAISPGGSIPHDFTYTLKAKDQENVDKLVQVRCVKITSNGFYQRWPKEGSLLVNNKILEDFVSPPNMVESLIARKRWDRPFVVNNLVPGAQNQVAVVKRKDTESYAYGLYHVGEVSVLDLAASWSKETVLTEEYGRAFVARLMSPGEEVYTPNLTQVLRCPLTRLLPDLPVRGRRCSHVQCFDLLPYIVLQEQATVNRWKCPICLLPAHCVERDLFIERIVGEARKLSSCYTVEFEPGGNYRLVQEESEQGEREEDWTGRFEGPAPRKRAKCIIRRLCWTDFIQRHISDVEVRSSTAYRYSTGMEIRGA